MLENTSSMPFDIEIYVITKASNNTIPLAGRKQIFNSLELTIMHKQIFHHTLAIWFSEKNCFRY